MDTTETSDADTRPVGTYRVNCPHCHAAEGAECRTASGKPSRSHRARLDWYQHAMLYWRFEARILTTDARLGVTADETYIAKTYWHDPAQVTLLARLPDLHDPAVNQYRRDIDWVRWIPADEYREVVG